MPSRNTIEVVIDGQNRAGPALSQLNQQLGGVQSATGNALKGVQGLSSGLQNLTSMAAGMALGNVITAGLAQASQALAGIKDAMIGGNAAFETYQTQFGVLLKGTDTFAVGVERAKERMADLAKFAATTPFELPEVVKASKLMEVFSLQGEKAKQKWGVDGNEILRIVGDVASGAGRSFEEVGMWVGRFSQGQVGEAIQNLTQMGAVSREQLEQMGVKFSKAGEMLTPVREAFPKLLEHLKKTFGGMMEEQSKTFDGMVSNIKDSMGQIGRALGLPIFERLRGQIKGLMDMLSGDEVQRRIKEFADNIGRGLDIVGAVAGAVQRGDWSTVWKFAQNAFSDWVEPAIRGLVTNLQSGIERVWAWIQSSAGDWWSNLQSWTGQLVKWAGDALPKLWAGLGDLAGGIGKWIGDAIPVIGNQLGTWTQQFIGWAGDIIPKMISGAGDLAGRIGQWIGDTAPTIFSQLGTWTQQFITWAGDVIPKMIAGAGDLAGRIGGWIGDTAPKIASQLGVWTQQFVDWAGTVAGPMLDGLGNLATRMWEWITQRGPELLDNLAKWTSTLATSIEGWWAATSPKLATFKTNLIAWIDGTDTDIQTGTNKWKVSMLKWLDAVATEMLPKLDVIKKEIDDAMGDIAEAMGRRLARGASDAAGGLVKGLVDGFNGGGPDVFAAATNLMNFAISPFNGIYDTGRNIGARFVAGITTELQRLAGIKVGELTGGRFGTPPPVPPSLENAPNLPLPTLMTPRSDTESRDFGGYKYSGTPLPDFDVERENLGRWGIPQGPGNISTAEEADFQAQMARDNERIRAQQAEKDEREASLIAYLQSKGVYSRGMGQVAGAGVDTWTPDLEAEIQKALAEAAGQGGSGGGSKPSGGGAGGGGKALDPAKEAAKELKEALADLEREGKRSLKALEASGKTDLESLAQAGKDLDQAIKDTEASMSRLSNIRFAGQYESDERIFALETEQAKARLREVEERMKWRPKKGERDMTASERIGLQIEAERLRARVQWEPAQRRYQEEYDKMTGKTVPTFANYEEAVSVLYSTGGRLNELKIQKGILDENTEQYKDDLAKKLAAAKEVLDRINELQGDNKTTMDDVQKIAIAITLLRGASLSSEQLLTQEYERQRDVLAEAEAIAERYWNQRGMQNPLNPEPVEPQSAEPVKWTSPGPSWITPAPAEPAPAPDITPPEDTEEMAGGGVIQEPIYGVGRSGRRYSFGENGPETVTPGRNSHDNRRVTINVYGGGSASSVLDAFAADPRTLESIRPRQTW